MTSPDQLSEREAIRAELDGVSVDFLRQRRGAKWARYREPVLAAWVADMDFPVATPIRRVLAQMVEESDFGYPFVPAPRQLLECFSARMNDRYGLAVPPERVTPLVTVIQGFDLLIDLFSEPGEGVVVQTPIYPPFLNSVRGSKRRLVESPLAQRPTATGETRFEIDFDRLRATIDDSTRILMLCNPHNPTGRVFEREELLTLGEIAIERDLVIVADEIHSDLVYEPHRHLSIGALDPEIGERTVTVTSATKSFNLAGLPCAFAAFGSERLHRRMAEVPPHLLAHPGAPGIQATLAAWTEGEEWLAVVRAYLEENRSFLTRFLRERLPQIGYLEPEATYLAWLDARALGIRGKPAGKPSRFFYKTAGVALTCGHDFGEPGQGHVRLNFATSRQVLEAVLERMAEAVDALGLEGAPVEQTKDSAG